MSTIQCIVIDTKQDDKRKLNYLLCIRVCGPGIHIIYYNKPRISFVVTCVEQVVVMASINGKVS